MLQLMLEDIFIKLFSYKSYMRVTFCTFAVTNNMLLKLIYYLVDFS